MKKIGGVYSIIHIASGKPYIGSAIDSNKRWAEHKFDLLRNCHDNKRLQNAWNKYGVKAFEFKILEVVNDPSNLVIREQYWMDKLQSYDRYKGFNIRKVATSNLGLIHTPETIEKIKAFKDYEDRSGSNNGFFGRKHTEESLIKMRTPRSEEVKQKFSAAAKKRWEGHTKTKICPNCDNEFDTLRSEDKKFCSKKCSSKFYGILRTKERTLNKNCLICNAAFVTNRFQDKKYCSRKCWSISMKGNKNQTRKSLTNR